MTRFHFRTQAIGIFLLVNLIVSSVVVVAKHAASDLNTLSYNNLDEILSQPSSSHNNRNYLQNNNYNKNKDINGVLLDALIEMVDKQVNKMAEKTDEQANLRKKMEKTFYV